jgi:hypothetical protein
MNRLQELIEETRPTAGPQAYYSEHTVKKWIENITTTILDEVIDAIHQTDPSPKMIVHEPYRAVANNVVEHFFKVNEHNNEHNT